MTKIQSQVVAKLQRKGWEQEGSSGQYVDMVLKRSPAWSRLAIGPDGADKHDIRGVALFSEDRGGLTLGERVKIAGCEGLGKVVGFFAHSANVMWDTGVQTPVPVKDLVKAQ